MIEVFDRRPEDLWARNQIPSKATSRTTLALYSRRPGACRTPTAYNAHGSEAMNPVVAVVLRALPRPVQRVAFTVLDATVYRNEVSDEVLYECPDCDGGEQGCEACGGSNVYEGSSDPYDMELARSMGWKRVYPR